MNTKLLPCPFCGKLHTARMTSAEDLARESTDDDPDEPYFYPHSNSFVVLCDASNPGGPGGCGAFGGFAETKEKAMEKWNTRTMLAAAPARQPLTDEQIFANDDLMALNATHGMPMSEIKKIARAIEAAHGIHPKGGE